MCITLAPGLFSLLSRFNVSILSLPGPKLGSRRVESQDVQIAMSYDRGKQGHGRGRRRVQGILGSHV